MSLHLPVQNGPIRRNTPTQSAFLGSRTRFRLLCGGLGSGKTSTGARAFFDAVMTNPGCSAMMVAPTLVMFESFMRPEWERVCPKELILSHNATTREYHLPLGRIVRYGSAEVPEYLEGLNLGAFWADEVRYWKAASWRNLVARLRDKRAFRLQGIATSTPAMGWMEKEFNHGKKNRELFRIGTRENAHNLAPDYIENLELTCSPRLCKSLLDGEFALLDGQVYEVFEEKRHLLDWKYDPALRTSIFMDFGVRKSSVLFAQHTGSWPYPLKPGDDGGLPRESIIIFDELQPEQRATDAVILMIQEAMKRHRIDHFHGIFCDPAGNARSVEAGMTSVHLLKSVFGNVVRYQKEPQYTWIPNGVAAVERMLAPLAGEPRLYFDRKLAQERPRTAVNDFSRGVISTLRGYRYPEARDGRTSSDHPVKDGYYEHCADALRYGVVGALVAGGESIVPSKAWLSENAR